MPNAEAYRYGNWDAMGGNFFKEFSEATHTVKPFRIPDNWTLYRSFDYGLDKFACMWWAVDEDGRAWCFRSFEEKDLNVQDAAAKALEHTLPHEKVNITYAPPDMWSRMKDTGRTMAEIFMISGLPLVRADNNRVQGHMLMRYMLSPIPLKDPFVKSLFGDNPPAELPQLMFFDNVGGVIDDIKSIQADEDNPNDCAKQPHEITHTVDACRYFCVSRASAAEAKRKVEVINIDFDDEELEDYETYMTGGTISTGYITY
jgi:phage terminase large subunit